jgi:hypothetical protein
LQLQLVEAVAAQQVLRVEMAAQEEAAEIVVRAVLVSQDKVTLVVLISEAVVVRVL